MTGATATVHEVKGTKPNTAELKNMGDLWHIKKSAQDAYNEAATALADKYDMDAAEIKSYVAAKEQDKLDQHQRKLDSRQMLLEI